MSHIRYFAILIISIVTLHSAWGMNSQEKLGSYQEDVDPSLALFQRMSNLNLEECNIDDDIVKALAKNLSGNKSIVQLNLAHNSFGDEGGEELVAVLKEMKALQIISLAQTNIGNKTAGCLGDVLKEMTDLRHVFLSKTAITSEGYLTFFKCLSDRSAPLHISFIDTQLNAEVLIAINDLLKRKKDFIIDVTFQQAEKGALKDLFISNLKNPKK